VTDVFISTIQEILSVLICFVLFFGIGFILNMLIKTTWLPIWLYVIIVLPFAVWYLWKPGDAIGPFLLAFLPPMLGGVAGAYVSGWAIRKLRKGGYKMF